MRVMMLLKGNEETETGAMPDESIVQAMMKYNQELMDKQALIAADGLYPSSKGAIVRFHRGKPTVIDGPFAEAKELVAGYWVIQADSMEDAIELAKRAPLAPAGAPADVVVQLELRPLYELEDFPVSENESGWREKEADARAQMPAWPQPKPGKKEFMVIRRGDKYTEAEALPDEEIFAAMGAYNEEMMKAGVMLTGEGLKPTREGVKINFSAGKQTVIDGPFTESKELVAGFSLLQADSKEEILEWVKRWPPQDSDGEVELEIRQVFTADEFAQELSPELRAASEQQRKQMSA